MPKVEIYKSDLNKLIGRNLNLNKLDELFTSYLKAEIDEVEGDKLIIDLDDTNRPDTWAVEFMAHIFKGILGIEKGFKLPKVAPSGITIRANVPYRPYIAGVVIEGVKLNKKILAEFISFQDKLNSSYGRKRRKLAVGAYDLDKSFFGAGILYAKALERAGRTEQAKEFLEEWTELRDKLKWAKMFHRYSITDLFGSWVKLHFGRGLKSMESLPK